MLWLLVGVPLVAGAALLLGGRRADRAAAPAGLAVSALLLGLAITAALTRPAISAEFLDGMPFALRVDGLSAALVVLVPSVLLAVLAFSVGELGARFFGLMLLFADAMLVTVTATGLVPLLLGWEVMGAASYALIGFHWAEPGRARAGTIAFLATRGADLGLYVAAGAALAGGAGALGLHQLAQLPDGWRDVVAAGVLLAAFGKSAQLPFSFWLSRAMAGPSPVSAMLHSATMVAAGAYLLLRLEPLLGATPWAGWLAMWAGVATALALGAVAVVQRDLKQLLAASTCAQVGFMVLAAGAGAVAGGTAQLVAHAATKSLLFLCAGAWLAALGTQSFPGLRGAARRHPVVGVTFAVGALSLAGLPPLSIWLAKDALLAEVLHRSVPLYLLGLAATALSAAYAGRALTLALSAPAHGDAQRVAIGPWRWAPLLPLAAGAAALGLLALPWLPPLKWPELLASALVAAAAATAAAALVHVRGEVAEQDVLSGWLRLEQAARLAVVRPLDAMASACARFDERVVDGGVRLSAAVATAAARLAGNRLEWSVDGAVRGVARGARAMGRLARRPQTGQLHQYYAQAVVALALLALLLVIL
ncbi:NADH dehydrogenase [Prauserella muralis]|uniref:NADH dehydrogenase n=1 Tax=Prauserella muralis TaxID=588067 RepID=A0A2V4AIB3_9PSEU|nr:NADH dehydrogenase [Prauserella muralis]